jgi:inner membrane protein
MPSPFSHAAASIALGKAYTGQKMPWHFWALSIACAVLADVDILGSHLGIGFWGMFGHRGITHSVIFAALLGLAATEFFSRTSDLEISKKSLFLYFFIVAASHGILDALVDGVQGVAFLAPFDSIRYFLPWRPIHSSPIGMGFFSREGVAVIMNEIRWVWIPSAAIILARIFADRWIAARNQSELTEAIETTCV